MDKQAFSDIYDKVWESSLTLPHLHPDDVHRLCHEYAGALSCNCEVVGQSFEGRDIQMLTLGTGKTRVLAWSQMHGNEPTATASLFDMMSILSKLKQPEQKALLSGVTFYIIPMLNPDGALAGTRENAQGIDINRDAHVKQTPEGRILAEMISRVAPHLAFNLHDQNPYYAVGESHAPAILSFLAPPVDGMGSCPAHRSQAMTLIGAFQEMLAEELGQSIGRYTDEYSERAFGEYAATSGASCILIECGAHRISGNRTVARKWVSWLLLCAPSLFIKSEKASERIQRYQDLPLNREDGLTDVLLRNITVAPPGLPAYRTDVAIDLQLENRAKVREIGDLRQTGAFCDFDMTGFTFERGKGYMLAEPLTLTDEVYCALLRQGFSYFCGDKTLLTVTSRYEVNCEPNNNVLPAMPTKYGACFWLLRDEHEIRYAVLRGQLIKISDMT